MKHVVKPDRRSTRFGASTRHFAESAYRRGVQQTLVYAIEEPERSGFTDAAAVLRRMEPIAAEMRYESDPHPIDLDQLMRRLLGE